MIIEFIGTPGAGKSTLLPTVVATLRRSGFEALPVVDAARPFVQRTLLGKAVSHHAPRRFRDALLWQVFLCCSLLYGLRFAAQHPKLIWTVLSFQIRRPPEAQVRERKVLPWFFRTAGYYEFLKGRTQPDEALVFDEGFVHRVVQLYASSMEEPNPGNISAYLNLLPKSDYVVFVDTPREICEKRICRRGVWARLDRRPYREITDFVANCESCVKLTVDHISGRGWTIITVDNSADRPALARDRLSSALSQMSLHDRIC